MDDSLWLPRIDRSICTGCRDCIRACPVHALAQVDGRADLIDPDACTYCTACETICPVQAIELPFLICRAENPSQSNGDIS